MARRFGVRFIMPGDLHSQAFQRIRFLSALDLEAPEVRQDLEKNAAPIVTRLRRSWTELGLDDPQHSAALGELSGIVAAWAHRLHLDAPWVRELAEEHVREWVTPLPPELEAWVAGEGEQPRRSAPDAPPTWLLAGTRWHSPNPALRLTPPPWDCLLDTDQQYRQQIEEYITKVKAAARKLGAREERAGLDFDYLSAVARYQALGESAAVILRRRGRRGDPRTLQRAILRTAAALGLPPRTPRRGTGAKGKGTKR